MTTVDPNESGTEVPDAQPATKSAVKNSGRRRRFSVRKKILFAALVTCVFFGAAELLLAVLGVNPVSYSEDPFVGFTSRSPLFEEAQSADGQDVYRTAQKKLRWFNAQEFPATKRDHDYRIFCMGGSTTYGRPYSDTTSFGGWLRKYLQAADPDRNWQVVNAGGISYASYRVASLMEELIDYQPDLFIIYCGHNEFLERRTYDRLLSTPQVVRDTAAVLGRSRVYTFVRSVFNALARNQSQEPSQASQLSEEVDAILDGSVGPDDYQRDEEQQIQTVNHYRFNLERMIQIAQSVGARVILVNPASNERSMSPFKSQHRDDLAPDEVEGWEQLVARSATHQQAGEYELALQTLDQAIEIDPLFALSHFQRGEILFQLGRYPEAKEAYQRAIDEDICPLRILSGMRPVITDVASDCGVPLVDFQSLLEEEAEHGITGEDWFLDHVHATVEGYRLLAERLLAELQAEGIAAPGDHWTDEARQQLDAEVLAGLDEQAHGIALRNLAKVLSWARKYEEAGRLSTQASALLKDDAEAQCMAAYEFERTGQLKQAKESYRKALELRPDYAQAHYNLGHVHRQLQEWDSAVQSFQRAIQANPKFPGAHYNLGLLHQQANRLDVAAECFVASTGVNSAHPGSWEELGNVRLNQGRIDEAIRHLGKAIELEPRLASAHNSLGVAFARSGEMGKAVGSFEQALKIEPNFKQARQNLQRARNTK